MKRLFKLLLCVVMCSTLLLPFAVNASAAEPSTEAQPLRFSSDGQLKILHLTDLHMHNEQDDTQDMSELLIRKLVTSEMPDVAVITGDIAMNDTVERTKENIDKLMGLFDEMNIPVAVCFGNHDSERGIISREDLLSLYMQHESCIAVDDGELLPGAGSYNVPVLSSDGERIAFNLWVIDSGEYDDDDHYASTDPAIIQWYVEKSNELKAQNGGTPVNSLMFQHIIVPEIYDALKPSTFLNAFAVKHIYTDEYYVLDSENTNAGMLMEYPCPGYTNNGQFEAEVAQGDVLAMFFGHDHTNTFNVNYKGIDLVATPKAQFDGAFDCSKGARVITVNESDTSDYETHVVTFADLYDFGDVFKIDTADENAALELKTAARIRIDSFFYKLIMPLVIKVAELFTWSQLDFG